MYSICMPQLHLYVPDDIAEAIKQRAEAEGVSVSRLLARVVEREVASGWPPGYFQAVVGRWKGRLERPSQGKLERRASL